jgi:ribosomal protein L7/L12
MGKADEIKKLREEEGISFFEARHLIERKELFEQIEEIETLEDIKKALEKTIHFLDRGLSNE